MQQPKIYLASQSPRRKELLKTCGLPFSIIPTYIRETICHRPSPENQAITLALKKARSAANQIKNGLIIAADTLVVLNNRPIGKPVDFAQAKKILSRLNNSRHYVITAIAVLEIPSHRQIVDLEKTTVTTRKLSRKQLHQLAGLHLDKAGAYAVQQKNDRFVKKIRGDYYNVVGLPLTRLKIMLKTFGVRL